MTDPLLTQLRQRQAESFAAHQRDPIAKELVSRGIGFASTSHEHQDCFDRAINELLSCIKPTHNNLPILNEGGNYFGCWLESTGTISAEVLSRFLPTIAQNTFLSFAQTQRSDGLFPYKLTAEGAGFNQIQLVTPLARSVWNHYLTHGRDETFLRTMYQAMCNYDSWIAKHRGTRNTGGVEAFCAFDTGHDLSARFWHVPDTPYENDPTKYDPHHPNLPFIAPDLTANIACQRTYLAKMARELGEDSSFWTHVAQQAEQALFDHCFDEVDEFFYDRDANDEFVRVQSDVLLRVLACEIGDSQFFERATSKYLLNTRKFYAKFPLTSIALDDPRFNPAFDHNSWCGPTNFLSLIRAPHAFEYHGKHAELMRIVQPTLFALAHADRFPQTLDPFTGRAGFTQAYSPAILCYLDFLERLCGICPQPNGDIWVSGLLPAQISYRDQENQTAYARAIGGKWFELVNRRAECVLYIDDVPAHSFAHGQRLIVSADGRVKDKFSLV